MVQIVDRLAQVLLARSGIQEAGVHQLPADTSPQRYRDLARQDRGLEDFCPPNQGFDVVPRPTG